MFVKKFLNKEQYNKDYSHLQGQINLLTGLTMVIYDIGKLPKEKVLQNVIDHLEKKDVYVDYYNGCSEPGYIDQTVLTANWNDTNLDDFIETYFDDISIEWSDEWTYCQECNKAIRILADSHGWQKYYLLDEEHYEICLDCVKNDVEAYLEPYVNTTKRALPNELTSYLNEIGFDCAEEDDVLKDFCKRYQTGFHAGDDDTPEKALQDLYNVFGKEWFNRNLDYIFIIKDVSQFTVDWMVLVRSKHYDDN